MSAYQTNISKIIKGFDDNTPFLKKQNCYYDDESANIHLYYQHFMHGRVWFDLNIRSGEGETFTMRMVSSRNSDIKSREYVILYDDDYKDKIGLLQKFCFDMSNM